MTRFSRLALAVFLVGGVIFNVGADPVSASAADLPPGGAFVDDNDSIFETDIDRLGTAGVTKGCNPPTNDRYCPNGNVTRGQMAAFLHRALG